MLPDSSAYILSRCTPIYSVISTPPTPEERWSLAGVVFLIRRQPTSCPLSFGSIYRSVKIQVSVLWKVKMPATNLGTIGELKASLSSSTLIVTPDSGNYEESIKRWATSSEKPAVSSGSDFLFFGT
jgi:hypothetical protein